MKIAFQKIKSQETPFEIKEDSVSFTGTLKFEKRNTMRMVATLDATFDRQCDRCGEEVPFSHKEDLNFLISDGPYSDDTNELDVIEFFDGFIILDDIIESEINLVKSDYFYCESCQSSSNN